MNAAPLWALWLVGTLPPLGALWLLWRVVLYRESSYGYNRVLLLLAPMLVAVLPLVPRPLVLTLVPAWTSGGANRAASLVAVPPTVAAEAPAHPASWSVWPWLLGLYAAGVAFGLGQLMWQTRRLRRLTRTLPRFEYPDYTLVHTGGQLPTSSFGRVVFWDETVSLAPAEAATVLAHEAAHVHQRHTLDVLWLEACRAVLWPNPFVYLLLPALRLTHELLADREAAAATPSNAAGYPALLARLAARQVVGTPHLPLLHPFTFSFTLIRIAMLKHQVPVRRWKQWLVLPVLAGLSCLVGRPANAQTGRAQVDYVPSEAERQAKLAVLHRKVREAVEADSLRTGGHYEPGTTQQVNITNMNGSGEPVVTITRIKAAEPTALWQETQPKVYAYVEQMPALPGEDGMAPIIAAIQKNFVYPPGNTSEGIVFIKFTVNADGTVSNATIVKGLTEAVDQAVLAAVQKLPRLIPGRQSGKNVAISFTVPIKLVPER